MNSASIQLRPATVDDATDMVAVHYAAVHAISPMHYAADILSSWSPEPDEYRCAWLAHLVDKDSTVCQVALSATGQIVGFVLALPAQSRLQALYVDPGCSGQGVGVSLLRAVEEQCYQSGVSVLELYASYNAEHFYRHQGYMSVSAATQSLADGSSMGAILMCKHLAKAG
ncbi:hypothetical protein C4K68_20755 [Pokkaliibacter plantistimulans]|uniref:N-acetyltransferase domain-containing protein n=1 Tax=Proteobacteria bacterium 228 TaxID=2083153 RepID=A0A2S5KLJ2_9PROT|nr:GNAT family N-acetyltransferase [Pokkaliibacter plantistimulans]PPC75399.1 hypothetical protein C4K68_20755 [Pokkaliibacter plantistimulans]